MSERDALTIECSPTPLSRLLMTQHGLAAVDRRGDSDQCGLELNDFELNDLERGPRARLHTVNRS